MRNPSTLGRRLRPRPFIGLCVALAVCATIALSAAFSGHIYTSTADGTVVNANIYDAKEEVYLNGGPQNQNGAGLPNGLYYFQVTNPSGSLLLSTDEIQCRTLRVVGGVVSGYVHDATCLTPDHPDGPLNPANGSTPVQLIPFSNTTNSGGEYKVWLTPVGSYSPGNGTFGFVDSNSKTDNFKVKEDVECPPEGCGTPGENDITGTKFYDANVNGTQDPDEPGIPGWKIELSPAFNTTTDSNGNYAFLNVPDGTYTVCEVIPALAPTWIPTTPTSIAGITVPPDSNFNDFGNVCLGPGGGKTLGFWSNKNGAKIFNTEGGLVIVNALPLVNGAGAYVPDFLDHGAFKSWILSATATNMAYMLSAQLAAMKLNATIGDVDGGAYLLAGACGNTGIDNKFITVNDLIAAAVAQLLAHPYTTSDSDPVNRPIQECLKDALDDGNNNKNFVQDGPCDVNYSGAELSCLLP